MIKRLTGTCVLVLGILAFAGSASAGNGNGNGNGGGKPSPTDAAPGNSGSAPGQEKKEAPPAPEQTPTMTTTTAAEPSAAPTEGVKPSNVTAHETHAAASSNQTKQYGNGQTAGAIAQKNGAAGNTVLHGPGNSQPHKVKPCSGGHEVDVHALKGHAGNCAGPAPHPSPSPTPTPGPPSPADPATPERKPVARPGSDPASQPGGHGTTEQVASSSASTGDSQGLLAATERAGRVATLPFTGARLWTVVLLGLMLIAVGLGLRQIRTAEASVESRHDHTNRARDVAGSRRPPVGRRPGR